MTGKLKCAGESDAGRVRTNNEDRFYMNAERGVFIVVDGVGGQAAGEVAAEEALRLLRTRLEEETGAARTRLAEGIAQANNEIFRLAESNAEWKGMGCVLTAAIVEDGRLTVGHVGDTRLYKIRGGEISKITRDHSPVGELEDAGRMSETEAMRHPRRNEVLRDVGSEERKPDDEGFIDIYEIPFEPDCALLLCSDGLSDLVSSERMLEVVRRHVGNRSRVVRRLIELANEAGGKDNVTVVFVEGERFASDMRRNFFGAKDSEAPLPAVESSALNLSSKDAEEASPSNASRSQTFASAAEAARERVSESRSFLTSRWAFLIYGLAFGLLLSAYVLRYHAPAWLKSPDAKGLDSTPAPPARPKTHEVAQQGAEYDSISEALEKAQPGDTISVAPGEYREKIRVTKENLTLVSREPRRAVIRPPQDADAQFVAVEFENVAGVRFKGFNIQGAPERMRAGVRVVNSHVETEDVEAAGARDHGFEIVGRNSTGVVRLSHIHDNGRAGVFLDDGAAPGFVSNLFHGNGVRQLVIEPLNGLAGFLGQCLDIESKGDARPRFVGNVFTCDRGNSVGNVDWGLNYFSAEEVAPQPQQQRQQPAQTQTPASLQTQRPPQ